jgi:hypothetical protein
MKPSEFERRDVKKLEHHGRVLEELIDSVHQHKTQVQTLRIENGDDGEEGKGGTGELEEDALEEIQAIVRGLRKEVQQ